MKSFALATLTLIALSLAGCSGKDGGKDDKKDGDKKGGDASSGVSSNDLKNVAMTYLSYSDGEQKAPEKLEELGKYMNVQGDPVEAKLMEKLKAGDIVVLWKVSINDLAKSPGGLKDHVVAHEKDAPTKGGLVVMADAEVKKVTAEEFKKLKMATKADK